MDFSGGQNTPYFSWDWFKNMISSPLSYRDFPANDEDKLTSWLPEVIQKCLLLPRKQI